MKILNDRRALIALVSFILSILFMPIFLVITLILVIFYVRWRKLTKLLTVFILIVILMMSFLYEPFQIIGDGMSPTYKSGEFIVSSVIFKKTDLKRGDIVMYFIPENKKDYIGRIIGLPGDMIALKEGKVFINNQELVEDYLENNTYVDLSMKDKSIKITENYYFILKDNRKDVNDSRKWGLISSNNINNKVLFCYWNCK